MQRFGIGASPEGTDLPFPFKEGASPERTELPIPIEEGSSLGIFSSRIVFLQEIGDSSVSFEIWGIMIAALTINVKGGNFCDRREE